MNITPDFAYYKHMFLLGGETKIPQGEFSHLAVEAMQEIKTATFGADVPPEFEENIKMCCCALAQVMFSASQDSGGKTSEKVGTYSVSFESSAARLQKLKEDKRAVIRRYLADTGLLFSGV